MAQWAFRLMEEDKVSSSSKFVTLTYNTDHVPIILGKQDKPAMSLRKVDLQLFFKRLRKAHPEGHQTIKYYAVGEYGGKTERPHYHVLLYNSDVELIDKAWSKDGKSIGNIHIGNVEGGSIGYCLKYMTKQKRGSHWQRNGLVKEFALMSKGLGVSYLKSDENFNWHHEDLVNRMYCVAMGGTKVSMPRYYKDKLYHDIERSAISEAYSILARDKFVEKVLKQSLRDVWNEQQGIDAAYDRMYASSLKTVI